MGHEGSVHPVWRSELPAGGRFPFEPDQTLPRLARPRNELSTNVGRVASDLHQLSRPDLLRHRLREAVDVCQALLGDDELAQTVDTVVGAVVASIRGGGKILFCGNGGSAADAQHLAAELLGRFCLERPPYPAVALADNVAAVTAVANDYGYRDVFSRAVRGLGCPGDVLVALSTSGRSPNVVEALVAAREREMVTVAFVGDAGSPMESIAEHVLRVTGTSVARIQEGQMLLGHTIVELVEREL
jgi:D-sedoheptulose 7-phosphate isomerase